MMHDRKPLILHITVFLIFSESFMIIFVIGLNAMVVDVVIVLVIRLVI